MDETVEFDDLPEIPTDQGHLCIALDALVESPTNPRRGMDTKGLEELAHSIKTVGVLQPILVRPIEGAVIGGPGEYEIVAGHRRFRAAGLAGLEFIPVIVRPLTDDQALEIQITENLQRQDLSPLEEAEGLELLRARGLSIEQIAFKIGKSKGTVYGRLKLLELPAAARQALETGTLDPSIALAIARIPDFEQREKATEELVDRDAQWTYREASRYIQEHYMLLLARAPFDVTDPELFIDAGSCTECPHRTGNASDLFGDITEKDLCTLPKCFETKREHACMKSMAAAESRGEIVLNQKASKKIFASWNKTDVVHDADYVDSGARFNPDPKGRHWEALLGKDAPLPVWAIDGNGAARKLYPKQEAMKALASKYDWAKPAAKATSSKSGVEKSNLDAKIRNQAELELCVQIVNKASAKGFSGPWTAFFRVVARGLIARAWADTLKGVCARRGLEVPSGKKAEQVLDELVEGLYEPDLRGLVVEIGVGPFLTLKDCQLYGGVASKARADALKLFGVDPKAIEKQVRSGMKEPVKKSSGRSRKPAAKSTKKKAAKKVR